MQPLDLEVLDLQAPNHRPSDRQPANRQGTDSTGANGQRAERGRTNPSRRKLRRHRLLPAAVWRQQRTQGTSSGGHGMVLLFSTGQVLAGLRARQSVTPLIVGSGSSSASPRLELALADVQVVQRRRLVSSPTWLQNPRTRPCQEEEGATHANRT
jgi:hypothetical protein